MTADELIELLSDGDGARFLLATAAAGDVEAATAGSFLTAVRRADRVRLAVATSAAADDLLFDHLADGFRFEVTAEVEVDGETSAAALLLDHLLVLPVVVCLLELDDGWTSGSAADRWWSSSSSSSSMVMTSEEDKDDEEAFCCVEPLTWLRKVIELRLDEEAEAEAETSSLSSSITESESL